MSVLPPNRPWWMLIGPGLAAVIGLFLLTALYDTDGVATVQVELGLSGQAVLVTGVVAYLIAAVIGFPLGLLLGPRFPTAVTMPAVGVMFVGVLLLAFVGGAAMFAVGRVLSGLGAGVAIGVTTALALRLSVGRGIVVAVLAALGVMAAVAGPLVNQVLSRAASFRMTFLAVEPLLFVALVASAVTGIALLVMTRRPAQPGPYGVAHPSPRPPR